MTAASNTQPRCTYGIVVRVCRDPGGVQCVDVTGWHTRHKLDDPAVARSLANARRAFARRLAAIRAALQRAGIVFAEGLPIVAAHAAGVLGVILLQGHPRPCRPRSSKPAVALKPVWSSMLQKLPAAVDTAFVSDTFLVRQFCASDEQHGSKLPHHGTLAWEQLTRDTRLPVSKGTFGTVWPAWFVPCAGIHMLVAVKEPRAAAGAAALRQHDTELQALMRLQNCKGVVQIVGACSAPRALVLAHASYGCAESCGLPRSRAEAWSALHSVAAAVHRCHARGVVHCDVKPGNVLVHAKPSSGCRYVLADFGCAVVLSPQDACASGGCKLTAAPGGTENYRAPEQCLPWAFTAARNLPMFALDRGVDAWSMGHLVFEWLAGPCPGYSGSSERAMHAHFVRLLHMVSAVAGRTGRSRLLCGATLTQAAAAHARQAILEEACDSEDHPTVLLPPVAIAACLVCWESAPGRRLPCDRLAALLRGATATRCGQEEDGVGGDDDDEPRFLDEPLFRSVWAACAWTRAVAQQKQDEHATCDRLPAWLPLTGWLPVLSPLWAERMPGVAWAAAPALCDPDGDGFVSAWDVDRMDRLWSPRHRPPPQPDCGANVSCVCIASSAATTHCSPTTQYTAAVDARGWLPLDVPFAVAAALGLAGVVCDEDSGPLVRGEAVCDAIGAWALRLPAPALLVLHVEVDAHAHAVDVAHALRRVVDGAACVQVHVHGGAVHTVALRTWLLHPLNVSVHEPEKAAETAQPKPAALLLQHGQLQQFFAALHCSVGVELVPPEWRAALPRVASRCSAAFCTAERWEATRAAEPCDTGRALVAGRVGDLLAWAAARDTPLRCEVLRAVHLGAIQQWARQALGVLVCAGNDAAPGAATKPFVAVLAKVGPPIALLLLRLLPGDLVLSACAALACGLQLLRAAAGTKPLPPRVVSAHGAAYGALGIVLLRCGAVRWAASCIAHAVPLLATTPHHVGSVRVAAARAVFEAQTPALRARASAALLPAVDEEEEKKEEQRGGSVEQGQDPMAPWARVLRAAQAELPPSACAHWDTHALLALCFGGAVRAPAVAAATSQARRCAGVGAGATVAHHAVLCMAPLVQAAGWDVDATRSALACTWAAAGVAAALATCHMATPALAADTLLAAAACAAATRGPRSALHFRLLAQAAAASLRQRQYRAVVDTDMQALRLHTEQQASSDSCTFEPIAQALQARWESGIEAGVLACMRRLGAAAFGLQDFQLAKAVLNSLVGAHVAHRDLAALTATLMDLGRVELACGRAAVAVGHFSKAIDAVTRLRCADAAAKLCFQLDAACDCLVHYAAVLTPDACVAWMDAYVCAVLGERRGVPLSIGLSFEEAAAGVLNGSLLPVFHLAIELATAERRQVDASHGLRLVVHARQQQTTTSSSTTQYGL